MRQVIKGDGSDGTAALKAYLLAHDNVLSQELYEFSLLPRPTVAGASWIVPPAALAPGESLLWWPITAAPSFYAGDETPPSEAGSVSGSGTDITVTRIHNALLYDSPAAIWSAPAVDVPPVDPSLISRVYGVVRGSFDGVWGQALIDSPALGIVDTYIVNTTLPFSGAVYRGLTTGGAGGVFDPNAFPWSTFDFRMSINGSTGFTGITVFETTDIGFLIYYTAPTGPPGPPPPYSESTRSSLITDASSPLTYAGRGYAPANIKNSGFKSKIGLDVDSLDLEWRFRGDEAMITDPDTSATILTMLQGFRHGLWDGAWVKWRRTYMPTFGDCDTLGAVSMFRGRVADVQVDRLTAKITVNSITDMFNRQVPAQLIEANNRSLQIGPGLPPDLNPDPSHWTYFACVAGHGGTMQKIVASQTAPTADQVYAPGTFDLGYLLFQASPLKLFVAQVQHYDVEDGYNVFYLFRPLYVDPHSYGLSFVGFVPVPKDQTISGISGLELPGFPRVPLPEQAM